MADIYVDAVVGDDLEDGTSWAKAVKTLTKGIELLSGSETLEARNGKDGHEFKEEIGLSAHNKEGTALDHTKIITNDGSIIDAENTRERCVNLNNVSYFDFVGWGFKNATWHNLYLANNAGHIILDACIVSGAGINGIRVAVGSYHHYLNCIVSNNVSYGIACGGSYTLIDNCKILGSQYGIYETFGGQNIYTNNDIYNCSIRGFYMRKGGTKQVNHNYIHNNALGIYVRNDCSNTCEVYFNDIHDNTVDVQDEEGINWDKDGKGNYWGYGGSAYDSDGDAIGDDPKSIPGSAGSQDNFPLMCSYKIWDKCPYLAVPKKKWALGRVGVRFVKL